MTTLMANNTYTVQNKQMTIKTKASLSYDQGQGGKTEEIEYDCVLKKAE